MPSGSLAPPPTRRPPGPPHIARAPPRSGRAPGRSPSRPRLPTPHPTPLPVSRRLSRPVLAGSPRPAYTCPAPDGAGPPHARSHPCAPPPHTLSWPRATAVRTHHTPNARVQPATRSPGQDKCPLRCPHTPCGKQVISTQPALGSDLRRRTPQNTHFNQHGISTLPEVTFLGIIHVYFSGNGCRVWDRALRSRQNFHTCSSSGIIASQCWAGLQPETGHSHASPPTPRNILCASICKTLISCAPL